ncbi:MAG: hypothetical protein J4G14_13675 [Dehalococcoidia bacterium]|nr:hypothetical protein [Dehalococcoidia bacterium]
MTKRDWWVAGFWLITFLMSINVLWELHSDEAGFFLYGYGWGRVLMLLSGLLALVWSTTTLTVIGWDIAHRKETKRCGGLK